MVTLIRKIITFEDGTTEITHPAGLNLFRALHGHERPDIGWLGQNLGSFDIIPTLNNPITQKGAGLNIDTWTYLQIRLMNPPSNGFTTDQKMNWLVSQTGTDKVMSQDQITGNYFIPVPCISGGALVNVLDIINNFALIETTTDPMPDNLPEHLKFTWFGYTKEGLLFRPYGGVTFPALFHLTSAYVPLPWLKKV